MGKIKNKNNKSSAQAIADFIPEGIDYKIVKTKSKGSSKRSPNNKMKTKSKRSPKRSPHENIREYLTGVDENIIIFDPKEYDLAIMGIDSKSSKLVYNYNKLVQITERIHELETLDAIEWVQFNMVGMEIGDQTPVIYYPLDSNNFL